jgi:hypothetical protein
VGSAEADCFRQAQRNQANFELSADWSIVERSRASSDEVAYRSSDRSVPASDRKAAPAAGKSMQSQACRKSNRLRERQFERQIPLPHRRYLLWEVRSNCNWLAVAESG